MSLLSTLVYNYIKNVYSLLIRTGKTGDRVYTLKPFTYQFNSFIVYKSLITPLSLHIFTPQLYTQKK